MLNPPSGQILRNHLLNPPSPPHTGLKINLPYTYMIGNIMWRYLFHQQLYLDVFLSDFHTLFLSNTSLPSEITTVTIVYETGK